MVLIPGDITHRPFLELCKVFNVVYLFKLCHYIVYNNVNITNFLQTMLNSPDKLVMHFRSRGQSFAH